MRLMPLIAVAAVATATAPAAWAHARLVSATPGLSAVLRTAPSQLRLTFNEPVLVRFVTVSVTGPNGAALHVDTPRVDQRNARQVVAAVHGAGASGVYRVSWTAATSDMHRMTGTYTFTVRP